MTKDTTEHPETAPSNRTLRELGNTGIRVSGIAMGCWAIVGDRTWGHQEESDALDAIRAATDAGVNFFDTAEGYGGGYSEQLLAKALGSRRDDVVIGSKVSPNHVDSYEALVRSCDESLTNLKTDRIDVYHLHWPNRKVPIEEIAEGFARLKQAGKIRSFAVSNFGPGDLAELVSCAVPAVNQLPYNLIWRAIEFEIVPLCVRHGIGVTCYSPIAQGLLTGKFASPDDVPEGRARTRHFSSAREQTRHAEGGHEDLTFRTIREIGDIAAELCRPPVEVALSWLLAKPGVASVLVGARNPAQMRANAAALDLDLPAEVVRRLDAATDPLKQAFGTNPDMWQSTSRYR